MKKIFLFTTLLALGFISCKKNQFSEDEPIQNNSQFVQLQEQALLLDDMLLKNGSFENGVGNNFTNWTYLNGSTTFSATSIAGEVYNGARAMKVVNPLANGSGAFWKVQIASDSMPTVSGNTYRVRLWAKAIAASPNGIRIQMRTPSAQQILASKAITTQWAVYEWTYVATAAATRLCLDLGADANTFYVDEVSVTPASSEYSTIWGINGEAWDKDRIPDFTNAGYMSGNALIPDYSVSVDVTALGAVGDGVTDNTAFFRSAINQCTSNGTVYIPAGRYLLSDTLMIKKSGINIKGDGAATVLYFTKGLEELYPKYNRAGLPNQSDWSWEGGMITFSGNISGSGIQSLKIEFPDKAWDGHNFHERGYNGIGFSNNAHDGWIKNITLTGCDLGIWIARNAKNITVEQWTLNCGPVRAAGANGVGHHGVNIYGGYNLLQDFEISGKFYHDLSVESQYSIYNVFRKGKGTDICFDHHSHEVRKNIFTNINIGLGTRQYLSGGNQSPAGININETYWNITAARNLSYNYISGSAIRSNNNVAVGFKTAASSATPDAYGNWYESISSDVIYPKDLYAAQMRLVKNINVN